MLYPVKVQPLKWYGGKAGKGKALWIASLLPWRKNSTYVETHGGMAGVMCRRAPVHCEIFNDLDGRIVNWWEVLRTQSEEFGWQVQCTPNSRQMYVWAQANMDNESLSDMDRALAFHIAASQSIAQNINSSGWQRTTDERHGSLGRWRSERVAALAERFWNVQLECRSAERILADMAAIPHAVIYCDPPYLTADTSAYNVVSVDIDVLEELLLAQTGEVAISGYGQEWDNLGWQRHERKTIYTYMGEHKHRGSELRTEVLWTNYDALAGIPGLFAQED